MKFASGADLVFNSGVLCSEGTISSRFWWPYFGTKCFPQPWLTHKVQLIMQEEGLVMDDPFFGIKGST